MILNQHTDWTLTEITVIEKMKLDIAFDPF